MPYICISSEFAYSCQIKQTFCLRRRLYLNIYVYVYQVYVHVYVLNTITCYYIVYLSEFLSHHVNHIQSIVISYSNNQFITPLTPNENWLQIIKIGNAIYSTSYAKQLVSSLKQYTYTFHIYPILISFKIHMGLSFLAKLFKAS